MASPRPRRARRSTTEVHRLILEAATDLFARQGVAATSTRDIARAADVAEPLVYRHFGSKEQLVTEAVVDPLQASFSAWADGWRSDPTASPPGAPLARAPLAELQQVLRAERALLTALLASDAHRDGVYGAGAGPGSPLAVLLGDVEELLAREANRTGRAAPDDRAVRLAFAMAIGSALLDDLLFGVEGARPDDEAVEAAMAAVLAAGRDPAS